MMFTHTGFVIAVVLSCWIVCLCQGDVIWKVDRAFDGVIKTNGYPHTEVTLRDNTVSFCASWCTATSWCSSFFFLPSTGGCILNKLVFARRLGGQSSPGAKYFRASNTGCPQQDGYVWVRGQNMCFKLYFISTSFLNAYRNCTQLATRLLVLDSGDKNSVIKAYMKEAYDSVNSWYIGAVRDGAIDGSKTRWDSSLYPLRWLNGVVVATSGPDSGWGSQGPSNSGGTEGCMEFSSTVWNDLPCSANRYFICEKTVK